MERNELLNQLKGKTLLLHGSGYIDKWLCKYIKGVDLNDMDFDEMESILENDDLVHLFEYEYDDLFMVKLMTIDDIPYLICYPKIDTFSWMKCEYFIYRVIDNTDTPTYSVHHVGILESLINSQLKSEIEVSDLNEQDLFIINQKRRRSLPQVRTFTKPLFVTCKHFDHLFSKLAVLSSEVSIEVEGKDIRKAYDIFMMSECVDYDTFYKLYTKEKINITLPNPSFELDFRCNPNQLTDEIIKRFVFDLNVELPYINNLVVNGELIGVVGKCRSYEELEQLDSIVDRILKRNPTFTCKHIGKQERIGPSNITDEDIPF